MRISSGIDVDFPFLVHAVDSSNNSVFSRKDAFLGITQSVKYIVAHAVIV